MKKGTMCLQLSKQQRQSKRESGRYKEIKGKHKGKYKIKFFLGDNWKFVACICGLGAANQDYACIWCKCPRNERHDVTKTCLSLKRIMG